MRINLKNKVMARIYAHYLKSLMLRNMEYILPGVFLLALFASVSVVNVYNNMPKDNLTHSFGYLFFAAQNTEWLIQGALAFMTLWACFVVYKLGLRFSWKKLEFIKNFGLLRIRY